GYRVARCGFAFPKSSGEDAVPLLMVMPTNVDAPPALYSRLTAGFTPPRLPPASSNAFRYQLAFTLLYAFFEVVMGNAPLMAVKALNASDAQLQLPLAMASVGLFGAVFFGTAMAARRKKPFVVVPGFVGAAAALAMPWAPGAVFFLCLVGI